MDQVNQQQTTPSSSQTTQPASVSPVSSQNYFNKIFSGRLNRRNYFIGGIILSIIEVVIQALWYGFGYTPLALNPTHHPVPSISAAYGLLPVSLIIIFCNVSLTIRRLHDLNKTGWLTLIFYVPIVGAFYAFYVLFTPGTEGENKYGSKPLPRININEDILRL